MSWLVTGGRVLASVEVARTHRERGRGLLGRDGLDGAFMIRGCRWVHTIGMRFPIDVAYLDGDGVVLRIVHLRRRRVGPLVWHARSVVEASNGAFERWGLRLGDTVELRETDEPGEAGGGGGAGQEGGGGDAEHRADDSPTEHRAAG